MPQLPTGTLTFLFTDIERSTHLLRQLRERYSAVLADHRRLLRAAFVEHGGQEMNTEGDAFFVVFRRAKDAVGAAAAAQRALAAHAWPDGLDPRVRMGVSTGEPGLAEDEYFGLGIHLADRVCSAAHGGQVLISQSTYALVQHEEVPGIELRRLGEYLLKDFDRPEALYDLIIDGLPSEFPPPRTLDAQSLDEAASATVPAVPYKGLEAFQPQDAEFFFGREELVGALCARLADSTFLAVVGASGSGKSSLVRAGLLPAIWQGAYGLPSRDWKAVIVTPGTHPLEELAVRLATERKTSPGSMLADLRADPHNLCLVARQALLDRPAEARLVLVVDQFEEVFTLCRDEDARRLFVDTLVHVACDEAARARLVMAIRADFYSHCASYRGLAMLLQDHQAIVGPMSDSELRRAIELPAARADLQLEPGLVDRILSDLGDKPGTLPLLSHALLETWARRRGETLTLAGYVEAGGVKEAIARTADAVFLQLPDEQRAIARRIFLRLTEPGRTTEDTSRPANLAELLPPDDEAAAVHDVLDILARARLVTVGLDTAEVAHEALIREWPTLRRWLDEDRAALRAHRRLAEAAQEWERHGRDDDLLYRGVRLVEGLEWRERNPAAANELEQGYLDASAGKQERELREADERSRKEVLAAENLAAARDRARRLRVAFVLLVCLAATVPGIVDGRPDRVVELKTVDARFAIRGEAEVPPDVVIVGIDNATFDDLGLQWPLPRSRHARVIDRLREAGARVIAYQVQFTVATTAREDNALVEAVERAGNVVLGTTEVGPGGQTAIFGGGDMVRSVHARAGLVLLPTEQDGLIRRVQYGFLGLKNFALVAAEMATGRTIRRDELGEGAWIDYVGPSAAIPTYRFSRVLDGQIHPRSFRDKIVVVGSTAASLQDVHETPADAAMSGPEIQANTIATALRGFPLKSARRDVDIALAVMLGLLIPLTALRLSPIRALGVSLVVAAVFAVGVQVAFNHGVVLTFVYPMAALVLSALGALAIELRVRPLLRRRTAEEPPPIGLAAPRG